MTEETIVRFIEEAHGNAVEKGFYDCPACNGDCFTIEGGAEIGHDAEGNEIQIDGRYQSQCKKCNVTGIDQNKNIGDLLMRIIEELGAASAAHREGRVCVVNENDLIDHIEKMRDPEFVKYEIMFFESHIKDTREDHIAMAFLRLFDLCGYLDVEITNYQKVESKDVPDNVSESVLVLVDQVLNYRYSDNEDWANTMFHFSLCFCQYHSIPVEKHIEARLAYNRALLSTHGKNY